MPRGNDSAAAGKELSARLGGLEPNAEKLIEANAARWPAELRTANNRQVNEAATKALDEAWVEEVVEPDRLLAYAVRGEYLVTVSEDRDGATNKRAHVLHELQNPPAQVKPALRSRRRS
jgi:hypothetical protein